MMRPEIIVVGTSSGGLHALNVVLPALPPDFSASVVVVQHREAGGGERLTELLQSRCALPVSEPDDKEPIMPGRVYLAPPDYHLLIEDCRLQIADFENTLPRAAVPNLKSQISNPKSAICNHFALSTDEPVNYARPSIDVLFESAAEVYGERVMGVILTGANADGAQGLAAIRRRGGLTIAQDPATAEAPAMPQAAIALGVVERVMGLEEIGQFLIAECGMRMAERGLRNPQSEIRNRKQNGV